MRGPGRPPRSSGLAVHSSRGILGPSVSGLTRGGSQSDPTLQLGVILTSGDLWQRLETSQGHKVGEELLTAFGGEAGTLLTVLQSLEQPTGPRRGRPETQDHSLGDRYQVLGNPTFIETHMFSLLGKFKRSGDRQPSS